MATRRIISAAYAWTWVGSLPRCMDMVTADEAIRRIESYFIGGAIDYLAPEESAALDGVVWLGAIAFGQTLRSSLQVRGISHRPMLTTRRQQIAVFRRWNCES